MSSPEETIKSILTKHGFGKLCREESLDLLSQDLLGKDMDLTKDFEDNEKKIRDLFWAKNGFSLSCAIRNRDDIKKLYALFQQWIDKKGVLEF